MRRSGNWFAKRHCSQTALRTAAHVHTDQAQYHFLNTLHQLLCIYHRWVGEGPDQLHAGFLVGMGQKAVIADLGKSPWQDMKEKPRDKLSSSNGEFFIVVTAVPLAEPYFTVIDINNQVVGDGHPMSIAAEILEDLLRSAKGLLGIGDPPLVPQSFQ